MACEVQTALPMLSCIYLYLGTCQSFGIIRAGPCDSGLTWANYIVVTWIFPHTDGGRNLVAF